MCRGVGGCVSVLAGRWLGVFWRIEDLLCWAFVSVPVRCHCVYVVDSLCRAVRSCGMLGGEEDVLEVSRRSLTRVSRVDLSAVGGVRQKGKGSSLGAVRGVYRMLKLRVYLGMGGADWGRWCL